MSEIRDLFRIYGAIDEAVQNDPELRRQVARLLPVYRDPDAHWFDDFKRENPGVFEEAEESREDPLSVLEPALDGLARVRPEGRMRARRLFAIAVAGRAFPELKNQDSRLAALARNTLSVEGIGGGEEEAAGLLALLVDDELGGRAEAALTSVEDWWAATLELAFSEGFIGDPAEIGPHPCSGRLVWVDVAGDAEPAVTLKTKFDTNLSFASVKRFCDPERWTCFPFWCSMTPLGDAHNGIRSYREIVSLDCDNKERSWTVEVDLDFTGREEDGLAVTQYRLKDDLPQERVLVNAGTLKVIQLGPEHGSRVRLKTTKRLKFAGSFDGPAFASVLCQLGYLGFVEDLMTCAAEDEGQTAVFPIQQPADADADRTLQGAPEDYRGLTGATIQQAAAAAEQCIDECGKAAKTSYEKIAQGTYTADALLQDVADMYVRMVGEGATFVDIGLRGARGAPPAGSGEQPAGRGEGESPAASATETPIGEVIENYTELSKELIRKWRDYGTGVATKLDARAYDADSATADLATAVSLGIETSARLAWEAVDSVSILAGHLDRPYVVESEEEFSTSLPGAALVLKGNLVSGFRDRLSATLAQVIPAQLGENETKFKLRVDATGHPAGTYWGKVEASKPDGQTEEVSVQITVP